MTRALRPLLSALLAAVLPAGAWAQSPFLRAPDTRTATPESLMGQRKVWGADFGLGGSFNRGNTDVDYVSSSFDLFRAFGPASGYLNGALLYNAFGGVRTLNQGSIIARGDYRVRGSWKAFAFNTEAYNEFLKLDYRTTTGAGPWYDWVLGPVQNGTSLAVIHEYERFHGGLSRHAARLSLRSLSAVAVSPTAQLRADVFYVPKADDLGDHRVSVELSVETTIRKAIGLKLAWLDEFDSRPQPGVKKNDTHLVTSLTFSFGK